MTAAKHEILQGWKDIATYVSRDVRTVRRWEKQRGLPVRRMPGEGRANVYALVEELDEWMLAGVGVRTEVSEDLEASPLKDEFETLEVDAVPGDVVPALEAPAQAGHFIDVSSARRLAIVNMLKSRRRWVMSSAALVCIAACAAVALEFRASWLDRREVGSAVPTSAVAKAKASSAVKGVDELYLQGIYFYEQRTPEALERALKCFHDAIALDPKFAPPYAGLAQVYNLLRQYSMMPDAEAYTQAEGWAEKAIALDPGLPDAHASLGFVKFFWRLDPVGAESEFQAALALDANSALAHHWYASMLTHQGRFSESLAELEVAQRLEPTSMSILGDKAFALALGGHAKEARSMLQQVLNEDPKSPAPHYIMSIISLLEPRDTVRYLDELRHFAVLRHDTKLLQSQDAMEAAFRRGGEKGLWGAMLAEEERAHPAPGARTYLMAKAEGMLDRKEACLRDLESSAEGREPALIGLNVEPAFVGVRADPRFVAVVARMGLTSSR